VFRGILLDLINESAAVSAEAMDGGWTRYWSGLSTRVSERGMAAAAETPADYVRSI